MRSNQSAPKTSLPFLPSMRGVLPQYRRLCHGGKSGRLPSGSLPPGKGKPIEGIEDFLFRYCEPEPLTEEGFPIYMLKTKAPNSSCIFLTDGRCSVYPARTRTCRIYPLTVGPGERGRDFEYFLCLDRHQSHFTGSRVSVKDWLYQNFKREDKEYVKREYEIATELGKLMRAIDPTMRPGIVFKVLYYRHYNFDLDQPFQPQYEQNNRHLLADLHRIAGEQ